MATKEVVETLFDVLQGTKTIPDAATLIPSQKAKAWSECWRTPKHLGMFTLEKH